ncbi:zinc finger CCCH domain-containing protein 19-like isoform X2 [Primulina huaijiensis]|uniref:zinc finger CCCH domain-containing protein 19-like isoform X2 n=1 Tax=Primulina huaijiensis TaxID=1492673 RepID=UPI003CC78050
MKRKGKRKLENKEDIAESWCFVCKDGGHIRICDHKECLKSYHPSCVGKDDDSFLESESKWTCDRHKCFLCRKSSYFQCYTCTTSFCRYCLPGAEFLQVKGKNGFCDECLKLALLIEESKGYDSDGAGWKVFLSNFGCISRKGIPYGLTLSGTSLASHVPQLLHPTEHDMVDFTDRESCEGLFMEYYVIIKEEEGFEAADIYAARGRLKKGDDMKCGSGSEFEEDEEQISDYEGMNCGKKCKRSSEKTKSKRQKSAIQQHLKSNKEDFIGWGSKSLIEFLESIGKSTSKELSQHDVTLLVNEYIKENNLFHPNKKKMVICDTRLQSLFRKKTLNKHRIYDLLEAHFAENKDESEEDDIGNDSENNSSGSLDACKRKRKLDKEEKSQKKELEHVVPPSVFASIIVENMKLVYLKRTLLYELLKQPESLEEKVAGSYVRVKTDPYDCSSKRSHQLMQVKGIKMDTGTENKTDIVLQVSSLLKEIHISQLSDNDFSKVELEQKARILHRDITKHWINKELSLLQKLIDRANEKGWRRQLFEYLEKKKRLQTPSEQEQLLENVAVVIPDVSELESYTEEVKDVQCEEDSPKSILQCNSVVHSDDWQGTKPSGENAHHSHVTQTTEISASSKLHLCHTPDPGNVNDKNASLKYTSKFRLWKEDQSEEDAIGFQEAINIAFPKG